MLLESKDLLPKIENIAKDLHVRWAIEATDNEVNLAVSKVIGPIGTSEDAHELEIKATNFMSAVNKLTLPAFDEEKKEEKKEKEDDWEGDDLNKDDELKFVNSLLDNIEDARGAMILHKGIPPVILALTEKATMIGHYCLKRMCESYIEKYGK
jgi:hypothetical protein